MPYRVKIVKKAAPARKEADPKNASYVLQKFDKSGEVAAYYGFLPIQAPTITKDDISKAHSLHEGVIEDTHALDNPDLYPTPEEKIALLRTYTDRNMMAHPHPVMLYFQKTPHAKKSDLSYVGLEVIGSASSVAEALSLRTALAILSEEGFDDVTVHINTVGDRESVARLERELATYYRKNINNLTADLRQLYKKDVFEILRCRNEKCMPFLESAPKSFNFLSDASTQHFKEVLEYLEMLNIPYKINNGLIGNKHYCSHTIFEIRTSDKNQLLAVGTRHNQIAKKLGFKKDIPIMSVALCYKKHPQKARKFTLKNIPKIKYYFVQFGFQAKLKSLALIETLRKIKLPIHHSLTKDKFAPQLASAENMKLPYVMIMGVKEAMEDAVVIRSTVTRAQETVNLKDLPTYLKSLK